MCAFSEGKKHFIMHGEGTSKEVKFLIPVDIELKAYNWTINQDEYFWFKYWSFAAICSCMLKFIVIPEDCKYHGSNVTIFTWNKLVESHVVFYP